MLYCVLLVVAFTQEIGAALNISFLWIELSDAKISNRKKNLTWTRRAFFILQWVLLASFGVATFLFHGPAGSLLLFCFFMVLVAVSFIIGANSLSKIHKVSKLILRSSEKQSDAQKVVFTSFVIAFDATVLSIAVCCVLASYENRSAKFGFFSFFILKLFNLHIMVAIIKYLQGKSFSAVFTLLELFKPVTCAIIHRAQRQSAAKVVVVNVKRDIVILKTEI